jgi:hypothetical protein
MVQPVTILPFPEVPVVVAEVAEPLTEKGTCMDEVPLAGARNTQLLKLLLSAWFHKWATNAYVASVPFTTRLLNVMLSAPFRPRVHGAALVPAHFKVSPLQLKVTVLEPFALIVAGKVTC